MAIATIFQRFDLVLADESYSLRLKQTMTLKPEGLVIRAIPRANVPPLVVGIQGNTSPDQSAQTATSNANGNLDGKKKLNVLYGSNTGSCEAFAQRIVSIASSKGTSARFRFRLCFWLTLYTRLCCQYFYPRCRLRSPFHD